MRGTCPNVPRAKPKLQTAEKYSVGCTRLGLVWAQTGLLGPGTATTESGSTGTGSGNIVSKTTLHCSKIGWSAPPPATSKNWLRNLGVFYAQMGVWGVPGDPKSSKTCAIDVSRWVLVVWKKSRQKNPSDGIDRRKSISKMEPIFRGRGGGGGLHPILLQCRVLVNSNLHCHVKKLCGEPFSMQSNFARRISHRSSLSRSEFINLKRADVLNLERALCPCRPHGFDTTQRSNQIHWLSRTSCRKLLKLK